MKKKAKILLVDDDQDLVAALRIVLEGAGYQVLTAYDAHEGRTRLDEDRPDLVVLDVMMPDATEGFHFVWQLRRQDDKYFRTVPIIILTAIHDRTELRFYPDAGDGTYEAGEYLPVQDFVDKPVDPDRLVERVDRALRLWAAE